MFKSQNDNEPISFALRSEEIQSRSFLMFIKLFGGSVVKVIRLHLSSKRSTPGSCPVTNYSASVIATRWLVLEKRILSIRRQY